MQKTGEPNGQIAASEEASLDDAIIAQAYPALRHFIEQRAQHPGRCSFCGATLAEVRKLVVAAGKPTVAICDACVYSCVEVLKQPRTSSSG